MTRNTFNDDDYDSQSRDKLRFLKSPFAYYSRQERLTRAVKHGQVEAVKALLAAGVDIHAHHDRSLRFAALYGHSNIVKLLLESGADVHALNNFALRVAAGAGHAETLRVLLEFGADVHAINDQPLSLATSKGNSVTERVLREWMAQANHAISSGGRHSMRGAQNQRTRRLPPPP